MTAFMNGYRYIVSILPESKLFTDGPFSSVTNPREFVIRSQLFGNAETCELKLNNLLSTLAAVNRQLDGKQYVIAKILNPMGKGETPNPEDNWTSDLMLKAFITEVQNLKSGAEIDYDIKAEIRISPMHLDPQSQSVH
jgi:hypothetical protein